MKHPKEIEDSDGNDDDFELITGLDEEDVIKAFRLSTFTSEKGIKSKFRL